MNIKFENDVLTIKTGIKLGALASVSVKDEDGNDVFTFAKGPTGYIKDYALIGNVVSEEGELILTTICSKKCLDETLKPMIKKAMGYVVEASTIANAKAKEEAELEAAYRAAFEQ